MSVIRLGQGSNCTQCPPSIYNFSNIVIYVFYDLNQQAPAQRNRIQNSEKNSEPKIMCKNLFVEIY